MHLLRTKPWIPLPVMLPSLQVLLACGRPAPQQIQCMLLKTCVCICYNKTVDFAACDAAEFAGAAGVRPPCTTVNPMHVFEHVCVHLLQTKPWILLPVMLPSLQVLLACGCPAPQQIQCTFFNTCVCVCICFKSNRGGASRIVHWVPKLIWYTRNSL